jgi:hypothetical protein
LPTDYESIWFPSWDMAPERGRKIIFTIISCPTGSMSSTFFQKDIDSTPTILSLRYSALCQRSCVSTEVIQIDILLSILIWPDLIAEELPKVSW